jgi:hypothetical protein
VILFIETVLNYIELADLGLRAIANLAYDDENRERLGQSSICDVIVMLLNKHGLTNPFVAVAGSFAISVIHLMIATNSTFFLNYQAMHD